MAADTLGRPADPDDVLHHVTVADVETLRGAAVTEQHTQLIKDRLATALSDALTEIQRAEQTPATTSVLLCGRDPDWASCGGTVRALLFGEMLKRTKGILQAYQSDLWHDAVWVNENVNGPAMFDWLVRSHGTNIGESARDAVRVGAGEGAQLYSVSISSAEGTWYAAFSTIPLDDVA